MSLPPLSERPIEVLIKEKKEKEELIKSNKNRYNPPYTKAVQKVIDDLEAAKTKIDVEIELKMKKKDDTLGVKEKDYEGK